LVNKQKKAGKRIGFETKTKKNREKHKRSGVHNLQDSEASKTINQNREALTTRGTVTMMLKRP